MEKSEKQKLIGQAIKDTRKKLNLTQTELSEAIKISRNYISDLENGRYMPSVNTLFKLASFLELNLNFFIQNDGNTSKTTERGEVNC